MAVEFERRMKLLEGLIRATAPSAAPDDAHRPSHWTDGMYYLLRQTELPEYWFQNTNWNQAPRFLAMQMINICAEGDQAWFDSLESVVNKELKARYGEA